MSGPFPKFRTLVVRPTLEELGMWSPAAENLVYGTALTESGLAYLQQRGGGPALGLWQMEPATFNDIRVYLVRRHDLAAKVMPMALEQPLQPSEIVYNLKLACAMCRIHYWRVEEKLPAANDLAGLGAYWKRYYNTELGKGEVLDFQTRGRQILKGD
ncbi:MAG: hypothetical protein V7727_18500 [Sneathiella sp.]